jgi:tetratricopeptide (TPR) repeat protein
VTLRETSAEVVGSKGAEARIGDLHRRLSTTTDQTARARLRVRLADLLSAKGDRVSAVAELRQAAAEGPISAGLLLAARIVAAHLPVAQADALTTALNAKRPMRPSKPKGSTPSLDTGAATSDTAVPVLPTMAPLPSVPRETPERADVVEAAFAALAGGKPVRARRLGEEGARAAGPSAPRMDRLRALVVALDQARAKRESLRLARTLLENDGDTDLTSGKRDALEEIVQRATREGAPDLASRWLVDLGRSSARAPTGGLAARGTTGASPMVRFRDSQRAAFMAVLGERRSDSPSQTEILRLAFDAEPSPLRGQTLTLRWADALRDAGDNAGAMSVLARAIEELPPQRSSGLRRARADLLRVAGRDEELSRALEADARVTSGATRMELRAEQARLLDRLGRFDGALEVRLAALEDAPGDLGLLALARQRLEGMGRLDRSLDLASSALPHVHDHMARAGLLRDIATLAEALSGGKQTRAALAWLGVLALTPDDEVAAEAAERLLRQTGDRDRLGALLAWRAARGDEPTRRGDVLWRLAEFRRTERELPFEALALYREIIAADAAKKAPLPFAAEDWQRRDDLLAVHTARALAAPTAGEMARAIADRADLLTTGGRLDDAERDLWRAIDLDPTSANVLRVLERLYERRGDLRGLRQRLLARVEGVTGAGTTHFWVGIGRANEALGDLEAAASAYERAIVADGAFRPPVTMLRQLAISRGDFAEAGRLLQKEIALTSEPGERTKLSVELGVLLASRLGAATRAVAVLEEVLVLEPENTSALDAIFGAALTAGAWERAARALEALMSAGPALSDSFERYHRVGLAAEKSGQIDRALGLYSRSYARNPAFRPTLERLSEICFERQQWDNAWKATEHLLERHGTDLDAETRAELALRSALADLHIAQRAVAANRIAAMLAGPSSPAGLRDVADSWASLRFDPRLLAGIDGDRRSRVHARLGEVLTLTAKTPSHPARAIARETQTALAMVDQRWTEVLSSLDGFGADGALDTKRRGLFLVSAGDILLYRQGDMVGATLRYQRAGALNPQEPRLARQGIVQLAPETPSLAGGALPGGTRTEETTGRDAPRVTLPASGPANEPTKR